MMRLAIGGPTRDTGPVSFAVDLAYLFDYTKRHGPWLDVTVGFIPSTYIHVGRELFLQACIKQDATHILWLDTDMSVPRTTALQLLAHDQPIVGCNYRVRQDSGIFTAQSEDGTRIQTTPESRGLEEVAGLGFGVVLMRTDILQGLTRPLFRHGLNMQNGDVGEDILFCRTLRAAGYPIYVDHDLSKEVGHIGLHTYRTVHADAAVLV